MKSALALLVVVAASIAAGGAQAGSGLYLTADYNSTSVYNSASISLAGDQNALSVDQTFDGLGGPNLLSVDISGNLNGGLLGTSFDSPLSFTGLTPGHLVQAGHDNSLAVTVAGSQNLFAATQLGSHNELTATIIGNNNQAAVLQSGNGNAVSFAQIGNGNRLSVIQRSY